MFTIVKGEYIIESVFFHLQLPFAIIGVFRMSKSVPGVQEITISFERYQAWLKQKECAELTEEDYNRVVKKLTDKLYASIKGNVVRTVCLVTLFY